MIDTTSSRLKKTATPAPGLVGTFKILDDGTVPHGTGAILCTKEEFSAVSKDVFIVPMWMI